MCSILKDIENGKRGDIIDERIIKPRLAAYRLIKYTERILNFLPRVSDNIIEDMRETEVVINKSWLYRKQLKKILANCEAILFDIHAYKICSAADSFNLKDWNNIFEKNYKEKLNESKLVYNEIGIGEKFF